MTPTADGFRLHLGSSHPLALIAGERCTHLAPQIGGVACGVCWESAIRDDERFVVENDLPRELVDQAHVDDVAVQRAVGGEHLDDGVDVGRVEPRGVLHRRPAGRWRRHTSAVCREPGAVGSSARARVASATCWSSL